jgi:hypothetical protein
MTYVDSRRALDTVLWQRTSPVASVLIAGEVLGPGQRLESPNGAYAAVMCPDGSVVVCRSHDQAALWWTSTAGHAGASLLMLDNGDLVVRASTGEQVWSSGTRGHPGSFVQLHDDGRLVVHDFYRTPLWCVGRS